MKRLTLILGSMVILCISLAQWIVPDHTVAKATEINYLLPEPIKVTPFTIKTGERRKGQNLSESVSWMNESVVQVENISGKAIKYLTLEISFPDAESFKLPFILGYGQAPGEKPGSKLAEVLKPGAKVNLSIGQNTCDLMRSSILARGTQPPSGSQVRSRINGVIFADGTAWFDGLLHIPDRNNPSRWYVVGESPDRAILDPVPQLKMVKTNFKTSPILARPWPCYKRLGSEYVECCLGPVASGIFVEDPGGSVQPRTIIYDCGGNPCEVLVSQGCGLP